MIVVVVMLPKKEGVQPSAVPHYFLVKFLKTSHLASSAPTSAS